jgi:hypothetical protein
MAELVRKENCLGCSGLASPVGTSHQVRIPRLPKVVTCLFHQPPHLSDLFTCRSKYPSFVFAVEPSVVALHPGLTLLPPPVLEVLDQIPIPRVRQPERIQPILIILTQSPTQRLQTIIDLLFILRRWDCNRALTHDPI